MHRVTELVSGQVQRAEAGCAGPGLRATGWSRRSPCWGGCQAEATPSCSWRDQWARPCPRAQRRLVPHCWHGSPLGPGTSPLSTANVTSLAPLTQNFEVPQARLQTGVPILKTQPALISAPTPTLGVQRFASLRRPQPGGDRETIRHGGPDVAPGKTDCEGSPCPHTHGSVPTGRPPPGARTHPQWCVLHCVEALKRRCHSPPTPRHHPTVCSLPNVLILTRQHSRQPVHRLRASVSLSCFLVSWGPASHPGRALGLTSPCNGKHCHCQVELGRRQWEKPFLSFFFVLISRASIELGKAPKCVCLP